MQRPDRNWQTYLALIDSQIACARTIVISVYMFVAAGASRRSEIENTADAWQSRDLIVNN